MIIAKFLIHSTDHNYLLLGQKEFLQHILADSSMNSRRSSMLQNSFIERKRHLEEAIKIYTGALDLYSFFQK